MLVAAFLLVLMVSSVSAVDLKNLGVGYYDSGLSIKYALSKELSVQGILAGGFLGAKANYNLQNNADYNLYGYAKAGATSASFTIGAGAGVEYYLFKALDLSGPKELKNIAFMLDLGLSYTSYKQVSSLYKIEPDIGLDLGIGLHYYFK